MNKMTTTPEYRVGVGASSILMIFIVLSLTTLGILSFASARADLVLTQRRQAQVTAYYEARARAQVLLADIDGALYAAGTDEDAYEKSVRALAQLDPAITVDDNLEILIALPVGDSQQLELQIEPGGAGNPQRYRVTNQCLRNTAEWNPQEDVQLVAPEVDNRTPPENPDPDDGILLLDPVNP